MLRPIPNTYIAFFSIKILRISAKLKTLLEEYWKRGMVNSTPGSRGQELALADGFDVPKYLESASTFPMGNSVVFKAAHLWQVPTVVAEVLMNTDKVPMYKALQLTTGNVLRIGTYLAVAGGFDVLKYLESASTFPME